MSERYWTLHWIISMSNAVTEKTYILAQLGCANCAAKMENRISQLPQVEEATITFATRQLRVKAEDPDALIPEMQKICQNIESQVRIEQRSERKSSGREDSKPFLQMYSSDLIPIIIGAVVFTVGMVLHHGVLGESAAVTLIFLAGYLVLGWPVLREAAGNIAKGQIFDENFLMSIATIAAFAIGDAAEGMGVMLFYRIGEFFEHVAVERSRAQIMDAVDMRPETVNLVRGGTVVEIPAEDALPGDVLLVRPGDRIPLDGVIVEGTSRIDTSPVTGEPVPVSAGPDSSVISGCVNIEGLIRIRVDKALEESMVTRILDSVENAAAGKPRIDRFITRFARVYTPIVVGLAAAIAIIPSLVTGEWNYWLTAAITFLVISCPCALVISVPLAFFSGIGAGSKLGILFKGGASIEALKQVKAVVMDKTGTVTEGNFVVQNVQTAGNAMVERVLSMAGTCEEHSTHPIARSIMDEIKRRNIRMAKASSAEELSGRGIKAETGGRTILCGNAKLMDEFGVDISEVTVPDNMTAVLVALDGKLLGLISIADTIKKDAAEAVRRLKQSGIEPAMLTGDLQSSAHAVAKEVGIESVHAQLLPEGKLSALHQIRAEHGPVMFVGDGINDAPVLAGADVGAAMGSGADAAIEAADVVFMNSSVEAINQSISIAKATGRIAWQNVVFALAIKLLVMALGVLGFANIWAAVFADTGVAMLCILNSLRILWKKF